jgi:general stress protein YciG
MGGEARAENPQSLAEAGRKGGEAVVQKYGPEHMAEIGRKGGESSRRGAKAVRMEDAGTQNMMSGSSQDVAPQDTAGVT